MLDAIIRGFSHLLIPMFLVGMAGSALVVGITLTHDIRDFLADDGSGSGPGDSL